MKFVHPLLTKKFFFGLLACACLGTLPAAAQQQLPVIDVAKILLHDSIHWRTACFQDSLHTVTKEQLTQLLFTQPPKNVFRHLKTAQAAEDWWVCFNLQNSADSLIKVFFFRACMPLPLIYTCTIRRLQKRYPCPCCCPILRTLSGSAV